MTDEIRAPWTPEQVAALNRFQREGGMHPFTCGYEHPAHPNPILQATKNGWRCYVIGCDWEQDWAHAFMADPNAWPKFPFGERHGPTPEEMRAAVLVQVGWYCWRCRAVNRMACRSDNVPVHVPAEWADEMRAEIARREDEDDEGEPTPPQDAPHAPQDGPQRPDVGAETPDGTGGRQAGADGRETLREQYAAAIAELPYYERDDAGSIADAVLTVRDRELDRMKLLVAASESPGHAVRMAAQYAERAIENGQRADQLATTLRQALDAFEAYWARASYCGPGETAIQPEHLQAWRAVLNGKEQP